MLIRKINTCYDLDAPKFNDIWPCCVTIAILYFYLFQVPVINKIYFPISECIVFIVVLAIKRESLLIVLRTFRKEISIFLLIILFTLIRDLVTGEIVYFNRFVALGMSTFFFGSVILLYLDYKKVSLFNLLYWTCLIAAIFSLLLFFIGTFDKWYQSVAYFDPYYSLLSNYVHRYRAYGISENLLFTYPYALGIFASYSLLLVKKNFSYIVHFLIFLFAIAFNARIGFAPIILVILYIAFIEKDIKNLYYIIIYLFVVSIVVWLITILMGVNFVNLGMSNTINWVLSALSYNPAGSGATLFETYEHMIVFPNNLIYGDGASLFGNVEKSSDIGFVLQLYYGGLIFMSLLVVFLLSMMYRITQIMGLKSWFVILFSVSLIILNTKGFVFAATPGARLLLLLYMYFVFKNTIDNKVSI